MSFSRPIQWCHSQADPIWTDSPYKEPGVLSFCTSWGLQDLSVDTINGTPPLPLDSDINHLKNLKRIYDHYYPYSKSTLCTVLR